ncbi:hypothetical protein PSAN_06540 [Pseudomonas antarctica]|uniref:Uncharacterized protein n=1 Tax=Pseudomonas antarctica TaxID=219572 RepID=A0ABQ6ZVC3_9PSED|nr:hypothetical protein PSAN_06540 [Pseudomonas antarctica]
MCAPSATLLMVWLTPASSRVCLRPPPAPMVSSSTAMGARALRRVLPTSARGMPAAQPRQTTAAITARPRAISGSPRNFKVNATGFSGDMATLAKVLPSIKITGSKMISNDTPKLGWRGALGGALNNAPMSAGSSTCMRLDSQLP